MSGIEHVDVPVGLVPTRISRVRCVVVTRRYDGTQSNSRHVWTEKRHVVLIVETAGGPFGLGEIYCDASAAVRQFKVAVEDGVAPHLIGRDAREIGAIRQTLLDLAVLSGRGGAAHAVQSAVDIALWDLLGKEVGRPLFRLLGGFADRVRAYGSGGMFVAGATPAEDAARLAEAVALGLGGIKLKVAGGPLADDVARVCAARDRLGPNVPLMIDAMFVPSVPEAIRIGLALAPFDIHFFEAPTHVADIAGWREVREATGLMLAGPELLWDFDPLRNMLGARAVHFLQWDVTLAGGLSAGRSLAGLAEAFRRPTTLHCSGTAIAFAATAHLGAALPGCDGVEFHLLHQGLFDHLWSSGWRLEGGTVRLPDRPGLGLDLDPADLEAMDEPA